MQRKLVVALAIVAGIVLIVLSFTTNGSHRYWPWLALLALGGRAAIAIYGLLVRRRRVSEGRGLTRPDVRRR